MVEVKRVMRLAQAAGDDEPRAGLAAAAELRKEAARVESVQVRRARAHGCTWAEIAEALGVTKQAAHRKYGRQGLLWRGKP